MKQSERLLFDIPQEEDFKRFYEIHSDPQTNLFNPNGPLLIENAKEAFQKFIDHWSDHNFGSWAIRLKDTKEVIGFGGLSYRMYGKEQRLNLGYRFDKDFWGKGYASEVSQHSIHYAFSEMKVAEIFAIVRPKHAASINVLEKCNMRLLETIDDVPGEEESLIYILKK